MGPPHRSRPPLPSPGPTCQVLPTTAVIHTVTAEALGRIGIDAPRIPGSLDVAAHAAIGLLPLVAGCDRRHRRPVRGARAGRAAQVSLCMTAIRVEPVSSNAVCTGPAAQVGDQSRSPQRDYAHQALQPDVPRRRARRHRPRRCSAKTGSSSSTMRCTCHQNQCLWSSGVSWALAR
ncbi:hypothetical protein DSI35_09815 [Mycobacterium tuberculosis]|uniref:Uncharacterized protein n=10 Tax=Mycobacterium tuberculosis complex TaxID=77643 RepID=I6X9N8_MYCTU|nr:hypothetical protein [Mycobacterium tuberculosis]NP_215259.1 hypothetical protein Rv0745 [Mycobacterium tuberculosis H37Rv]AAK45008.1 hypothetical protein MT0772 [Mycobacterium tuberculosis CDC1551]ABR05102.1 conserved hypothetical protein [Mycobacterium tuberculosis F11]ACT23795.1 conserved hypothetical protein [Mycobacterium tuberculosis KZN 1435]AEB02892.1 conserved hypothetical protein [Mycobacterium tuberculosis KZN 4207]AEM99200.1 hypothetical protein MTCTRI2_0761 [Mycobacterium tube